MKKRHLRFILILSSFLILFLSVSYIFHLEKLTKESYLIKNYQEQIKDLKEENTNLEQKSLQLFSLRESEKRIETLGFIKVGTIKYIPISANYLAGRIR